MQVQPVNNHAKKRYSELESAVHYARMALDDLSKTVRSLNESTNRRFHGWQVPSKQEVSKAASKASADLDHLHKQMTTFKAELISRGWRV